MRPAATHRPPLPPPHSMLLGAKSPWNARKCPAAARQCCQVLSRASRSCQRCAHTVLVCSSALLARCMARRAPLPPPPPPSPFAGAGAGTAAGAAGAASAAAAGRRGREEARDAALLDAERGGREVADGDRQPRARQRVGRAPQQRRRRVRQHLGAVQPAAARARHRARLAAVARRVRAVDGAPARTGIGLAIPRAVRRRPLTPQAHRPAEARAPQLGRVHAPDPAGLHRFLSMSMCERGLARLPAMHPCAMQRGSSGGGQALAGQRQVQSPRTR